MSLTYFAAGVGIIFLLLIFLLLPTKEKRPKKKRKEPLEEVKPPQDTQETALRLQKHIQSLREQIAALQKNEKALEHQLAVEKVKGRTLQEKLSQQRQWQDKEEKDLERKAREFHQLKEELAQAQESFSGEHMENLRFKEQMAGLKRDIDALNEQRRTAEAAMMQLEAKLEALRRETVQLKKENMELKQKEEDTAWVAKSDYERLQTLLREKDKQLQRLQRESEA